MISVYVDIQSLRNFSVSSLGKYGESFFDKRNKDLNGETPFSFYMQNPTVENYKKIIKIIENKCKEYN